MVNETINLDGLDGFAFEQVCERIFEKAGWGKVTRIGGVADKGRDLIIRTPTGKRIVVECKFYDNATVGRPIVQKLHSAIIDSHADSGIIVTTSRFSKAALEYAADLTRKHSHPIELFDLHKMMELAHEAGIELETGRMQKIYTYPVLDRQAVAKDLQPLINKLDSRPVPAADLLRVADLHVRLRAMYFATISVQQSFSTSVGLIHQIDVRDRHYMFDGETGGLDGSDSVSFFGTPRLAAASMPEHAYTKTGFELDGSTLRDRIMEEMVEAHTTHVRYRGRNNTTYVKNCIPTVRNIHINNLRQVYVPRYDVALEALGSSHACSLEHNGTVPRARSMTWARCYGCGSADSLLLCNECGRVAHASRFGAHGFRCRECGKTVCGSCVWKARRHLIFSSRFCSDCKPDSAKRQAN